MEGKDFFSWPGHGKGESKEEMRDIDSSFDDSHQENYTDEKISEDDKKLASTKAEIVEAIEENRRLKLYLSQIVEEYEALQTQYNQLVVQQEKMTTSPIGQQVKEDENKESELVSLSLGRTSSPISSGSRAKEEKQKMPLMAVDERQILSLGLDYKVIGNAKHQEKAEKEKECLGKNCNNSQSPQGSFGLEDNGGAASKNVQEPVKIRQTTVSDDGDGHDDEEEVFPQSPVKRARVSVRVRCDTPKMNDGCQWRKYGQKIAKGNPCPRAYYRCTFAPTCPVRKQVQRCAEDMSILITTYEGTHNHSLPMSAAAMASTTSVAASMLLSGAGAASSSSSPTSAASTNLQGFNCYLSNYSSKPNSFHLQTSSCPSSSSSHPSITLDLTPSTFSNPSLSFSSLFNRLPSSSSIGISLHQPSRSSTTTATNLKFSGNNMNFPHGGSFTTYGNANMGSTHQLSYHHTIQNRIGSEVSNQFGISTLPTQCNIASGSNDIFQQLILRGIHFSSSNSGPSLPAEAIKAITADPSFKSALANVISSIIGSERSVGGSQNVNDVSACSTAAVQSHGCTLSSVTNFPSTSSTAGSKHSENKKF